MSTSGSDGVTILAFGAHPDDIEFALGGVIARATRDGLSAHFAVCSRGESATNGTPDIRTAEAQHAAEILRASLEFVDLDGDAHLEMRAVHAIRLGGIIRQRRPEIVLAPTVCENQHPDHWRLGRLVRDATRLARYGGLAELRDHPPHTSEQLLYYAVSPGAEPRDITPILVDVSDAETLATWTAAMEAHASQARTRNYVEAQLTRARAIGLAAGVGHAVPLFPNDPLVFTSLPRTTRRAGRF